MKRLHVYLSNEQFEALKAHSEQQGVSLSRAIRSALPGVDAVRDYQPDGEHSRQAIERAAVERILAKIRY